MYTAKLSLNSENVDDVLAVASFLQMQDIITACHALKSLAEPAPSPGRNPEVPATEGKLIGRPPVSMWLLGGAVPLGGDFSGLVSTFGLACDAKGWIRHS